MITANTAHIYAMREREDNYIPKESFAAEVLKKIDSEIQGRALKGFFDVAIHKSLYTKPPLLSIQKRRFFKKNYSTVTDFARFRGLSMSQPLKSAT